MTPRVPTVIAGVYPENLEEIAWTLELVSINANHNKDSPKETWTGSTFVSKTPPASTGPEEMKMVAVTNSGKKQCSKSCHATPPVTAVTAVTTTPIDEQGRKRKHGKREKMFPLLKADINKAARTTDLNWSQSIRAWTKELDKKHRELKALRRRAEAIGTSCSRVGSDGSNDGSDDSSGTGSVSNDANDDSDGDDDDNADGSADGGKEE
jgi:hypothetical protein